MCKHVHYATVVWSRCVCVNVCVRILVSSETTLDATKVSHKCIERATECRELESDRERFARNIHIVCCVAFSSQFILYSIENLVHSTQKEAGVRLLCVCVCACVQNLCLCLCLHGCRSLQLLFSHIVFASS